MINLNTLHQSKLEIVGNNKEFLTGKTLVEFGVCGGASLTNFYKLYEQFGIPIDFVGFDSWRGLPEEKNDPNSFWGVGQFSTGGQVPEIGSRPGVKLVSGWFEDTLTEQCASTLNSKIGLAHVDCDTYTSTRTCWNWMLANDLLVDGSIIVYDDWGAYREKGCGEYDVGEAKAHKEVEERISFEEIGSWVVSPAFYEVKAFRCRLNC